MPCYPEICDYAKGIICQLHGSAMGPIQKAKTLMAYERATRQARIVKYEPMDTTYKPFERIDHGLQA